MVDYFAQYVWGPEVDPSELSITATHLYTLVDRRKVASDPGVRAWDYQGRDPDGSGSDRLLEPEITDRFAPLQLNGFQALMNPYAPRCVQPPRQCVQKQLGPRSRRKTFRLFPIGT